MKKNVLITGTTGVLSISGRFADDQVLDSRQMRHTGFLPGHSLESVLGPKEM